MKNFKKNLKLNLVLFIALLLSIILMLSATETLFKGIFTLAVEENESPTYTFEGYSSGMTDCALHKATKMRKYTEDSPSITVLVPGQGGDASHWSNNSDEDDYRFQKEEDSIIEKLTQYAGEINLYWAKFIAKKKDEDKSNEEEDIEEEENIENFRCFRF